MDSFTETETIESVQAGLLGVAPMPLAVPIEATLVPKSPSESEIVLRSPWGAPDADTPPRLTVLSVDDNDDLLYVTGLTLSMMGFEVISCSDADSASAAFRSRGGVDLLITDLEMPGRSGAELAKELCGLCSSLPVLLVSGAYLSGDLTREIQERDWQFLAKPYAPYTFSASICSLLSIETSQQQAA